MCGSSSTFVIAPDGRVAAYTPGPLSTAALDNIITRAKLTARVTASKFPWWTVLGIVLVVSLVIGSGALSSSPPTAAQRAAAIDSVVRCPR